MLLANPSIEELYHKSCALAEDSQEVKDSFQHPARLIKVNHMHVLLGWFFKFTIQFDLWLKGPESCSFISVNPRYFQILF